MRTALTIVQIVGALAALAGLYLLAGLALSLLLGGAALVGLAYLGERALDRPAAPSDRRRGPNKEGGA